MIRSIPVTGSGLLTNGNGEYNGFSFRETGGVGAAVIRVREGSATGDLLDTINIPSGTSKSEHYGTQGVSVDEGIYVEIVSGTVEGCIRASYS